MYSRWVGSEGVPNNGMPADEDLFATRSVRPLAGRLLVAAVLLLLVVGLGALVWMLTSGKDGIGLGMGEEAPANGTAPAEIISMVPTVTPPAPAAATPEALTGRVADLEQRIIRVSVAAQSASAYANRAEAIMVAFAALRALDAGTSLDYLEGQLRLLFGEAQPRAVATIINAAADPVTVNKLRAGLEDIHVQFDRSTQRGSWWSSAVQTVGSLFELRSAGTPLPEPRERLARARRAVEAGQIEAAIKEMAALPPRPAVAQWLEQARRYNEAHRALDVIEQAAILEPRTAPMIAPAPTPAP